MKPSASYWQHEEKTSILPPPSQRDAFTPSKSIRFGTSGIASVAVKPVPDPNIDQPDPETGNTPLMAAIQSGQLEQVKALLEQGASTLPLNKSGKSAIIQAVQMSHEPITRLLLKHGAPVYSYFNNQPLIHLAAASADLSVLKTLAEFGVDVKAKDSSAQISECCPPFEALAYLDSHSRLR